MTRTQFNWTVAGVGALILAWGLIGTDAHIATYAVAGTLVAIGIGGGLKRKQ